jgi:hypothetical protein
LTFSVPCGKLPRPENRFYFCNEKALWDRILLMKGLFLSALHREEFMQKISEERATYQKLLKSNGAIKAAQWHRTIEIIAWINLHRQHRENFSMPEPRYLFS